MVSPRRLARRYAVLALYQWQVTGQGPSEIARHFADDPEWLTEVARSLRDDADAEVESGSVARDRYDTALFERLIGGVPREQPTLDEELAKALDRPLSQVDPVERAILRLGAFELLFCPDVPYQVAINEAIDLAKLFGAEQGHRYVNGVLDRLARAARAPGTG
ncbi:transcription antitermination factor NusB [Thioalkalicoccus limnaeus]|uniref:Transcription antitermination protein NusB n=1 Tax=Thioalkalicoccus limnaeus TaxID=120681 RepID=A0ABV4BBE5_9GAMM